MKRCGSRFLQILVFLLLRCTMAQNLCGSKYICGDGTECVFFFCPCVESSEKDPWEIREGGITDGRLTLYCRKLCNMDTPVCPANRLCSTNQWNRSYCECPPGLVPSMFGQCVDPNATSTIPSTTGKTAPTTSVTQKSTATTGVTTTTTTTTTSTTTRNPTSNISQRATATTGATTTGKPTTTITQQATLTAGSTTTGTTTTRTTTTARSNVTQSTFMSNSQSVTNVTDVHLNSTAQPVTNVTDVHLNSTAQPVTNVTDVLLNSTAQPVTPATERTSDTAIYVYVLAGLGGTCALLLLLMGIIFASCQVEKRKTKRANRRATSSPVGQDGRVTNGLSAMPTLFDYSFPFPARQMRENATMSASLGKLANRMDQNRTGVNTERLRKEGFENKGFLPSEDSGAGSISTVFLSSRGGDDAMREENIVTNNVYAHRIDPISGDDIHVDDEEMLLPQIGTGTTGASLHMYDNSPRRMASQSTSSSYSDVFKYPTSAITRF